MQHIYPFIVLVIWQSCNSTASEKALAIMWVSRYRCLAVIWCTRWVILIYFNASRYIDGRKKKHDVRERTQTYRWSANTWLVNRVVICYNTCICQWEKKWNQQRGLKLEMEWWWWHLLHGHITWNDNILEKMWYKDWKYQSFEQNEAKNILRKWLRNQRRDKGLKKGDNSKAKKDDWRRVTRCVAAVVWVFKLETERRLSGQRGQCDKIESVEWFNGWLQTFEEESQIIIILYVIISVWKQI